MACATLSPLGAPHEKLVSDIRLCSGSCGCGSLMGVGGEGLLIGNDNLWSYNRFLATNLHKSRGNSYYNKSKFILLVSSVSHTGSPFSGQTFH